MCEKIEAKGKKRSESFSVMTELVLPNDANPIGNLLGGRLLHFIDVAGALAAKRHTNGLTATLIMDAVEFKHPIKVGSIVELKSYVTWTGTTSLEVAVETFSEDVLRNERLFINKVHLLFVGIDANGVKKPIPQLIPETDEEKQDFLNGENRRKKRYEDLRGK